MGKGKIIYHGNVKKLVVTALDVKSDGILLKKESYVVNKDAIFYKNMVGKIISFDYGTALPTYDEAIDCLQFTLENSRTSSNVVSCLYADYDNLRSETIDYNEFKSLSKRKRLRKKDRRF